MASKSELACVYASLIMVDNEIPVTGEKIQTILKAANVDVESYWPGLFAKALENVNPKELITNIGSGVGSAPATAAPVAAAGETAASTKKVEEAKKVEVEEESDEEGGFGDLFG